MLQTRFSVSTSIFIGIDEPIKNAINNGHVLQRDFFREQEGQSERMREQKREREGEGGWRERALNQWSENRRIWPEQKLRHP